MRWRAAVILLAALAGTVAAIDRVGIRADRIDGPDWSLAGFDFAFSFAPDGRLQLTLRATGFDRADLAVERPELQCLDLRLQPDRLDCPRARVGFGHRLARAADAPAAFSYRYADRRLHLKVSDMKVADGRVALDVTQTGAAWAVVLKAHDLSLAALRDLAGEFAIDVPDLNPAGRLSGELRANGTAAEVARADWRLNGVEVAWANADGTQAAERVALDLQGQARRDARGEWHVQARVHADEGLVYTDPLYFEFTPANALTLDTEAVWQARRRRLQVDSLALRHAGIADADARLALRLDEPAKLEYASVDLRRAPLPGFYTTYLQPWAAGTMLERVDSSGSLSGAVEWRDDAVRMLRVDLDDTAFEQRDGRFAVHGLGGELHWGLDDTPRDSVLVWDSASYYKLAFGKARVGVQTRGSQLQLKEPLSVDLLDGRLHIDAFQLDASKPEDIRFRLDGVLAPVSMEAFSTAIGWPPLAGRLSGMIPDVTYAAHRLRVGGTLLVQAFDGDITVRNLRIDEPAGLVPRLWADVRVEHLDLETLTKTFSFGRIEGQLQGRVDGLYMEAWRPVAFDARFETPPDDDSRRRISQKAVDSISNLGGAGVSGALSRGFLRFLEDFPYRRLGVSCRLEKGICRMDGVAPAANGYYLVQGRLLPPRLDMIGYSHDVDWNSLVDRLLAVTSAPAPRLQ